MPARNAAACSTTSACDRQCWNLAGEAAAPCPCGDVFMNITSRFGSGKGTGLSRTALTSEKIAVLAAMPRASAETAAMVNAAFSRNIRIACLTSFSRVSMNRLDGKRETKVGESVSWRVGELESWRVRELVSGGAESWRVTHQLSN